MSCVAVTATKKVQMSIPTCLFRRTTLVASLSAALLLGACASTPPNSALEQARSAYASASADPGVVRAAPADLRRAQEALQQAEAAQRDGKESAAVNHYAYLATRRVASAQQAAQLAQAEQAVTKSGSERDRILLDARTREADAQRSQAANERADAEQARRAGEGQKQAAEAARQQAATSNARADALERQLSAMNAKATPSGLVLTLGDVLFDSGRATLNPGAGHTVDQLVNFLKENPERSVQINGYTDSTGSASLNQALSENRANSVKTALVDRGISSQRVNSRGYGPSNPVTTNTTEAGRQQNRRIEIVISNATS